MTEKYVYVCKICGKQKDSSVSKTFKCCKSPMKKVEDLPVCHGTATAEHSRLNDDNNPCDDGRAGR